jgi:hypothetical protein
MNIKVGQRVIFTPRANAQYTILPQVGTKGTITHIRNTVVQVHFDDNTHSMYYRNDVKALRADKLNLI